MASEIPLISVIMPMYNVEKYIAEALKSVLSQDMENIEVIVVDDCSTDKSCEIVESFMPQFNGRLKLLHTKSNRGCAGPPRNKGLEFSRGKYIYFMDSDDVIAVGTLQNFYNVAENFKADVLMGKNYIISSGVGEKFLKETAFVGNPNDNTLKSLSESMPMRIKLWSENYFEVVPWLKFLRRDFLVENEIKFLPIMQEDSYWTFELICLAKNIIILPNAFYVSRRYPNSLSTKALNANFNFEGIYNKLDRIINGLKHVDEFMGGIEFFQKNPQYRHAVIHNITMQNIGWLMRAYGNIPQFQIYEKFKEVLKKDTGDFDVLISCLISASMHLISNLPQQK